MKSNQIHNMTPEEYFRHLFDILPPAAATMLYYNVNAQFFQGEETGYLKGLSEATETESRKHHAITLAQLKRIHTLQEQARRLEQTVALLSRAV